MRFSRHLLTSALVSVAACGPTYVVQSPPGPAPQRVPPQPPPPRVEPLQVNIVRPEEARVLIQTNRPAYVAVFEIVPGRGVSLVYPQPYRQSELMLTGLTWLNVYWTMRFDYDRRFAYADTRYIYAVASDTPLRFTDDDYDRRYLERRLGSTYYSSNPNATVRAISREFVRAQPDEWWGEDLFTMQMAPKPVTVTIRWARVFCPGGSYFEIREDMVDHVWCPARSIGRGRPLPQAPDSVFASSGRRMPREMDPTKRTPIFRVPAPTDVGQQQGHPEGPPQNTPPTYPRTQPTDPRIPAQNQPPQVQPQDKDHDDNGRRAHGDPRNADPRGNGNGYGNGGREQPSNTQPQQQGPQQNASGNTQQDRGNSSNTNPNSAKPEHNDSKDRLNDLLKNRYKVKQDDKDKKAASDSTDKKKP